MDWKENLAPLQRAAIKAPAGQALEPAPIAPSFDAVSADEAGMLVAAGKAQPGAALLLQNGALTLGETKADEHGEWVMMLEHPLPPGDYSLSLLSAHPNTHAQVPGQQRYALTIAPRNKGAPPAALQTAAAIPPPAVTPQPGQLKKSAKVAAVKRGDTLWAMAHRFYGTGARYGEIAGANKEQIKNPNLIYPKQQLAIPGQ